MQLRHHLSLEEREEAILIAPDLTDPTVVAARFEELTNGLELLLGIRSVHDALRDLELADELDRLLEMPGHR